jgi:RecA/RadA recombinase
MAKVTEKELMELRIKLENNVKLSKEEKKILKDNSAEEKEKKKSMSFGQRLLHVSGSEYGQLMGDGEIDKYPIRDWINTGNYLFNAQLSGDPYKGMPSGRVWQLVGLNSVGKTFLMLETAKHAQQDLGYFFVLFETEMANNSKEDLKARGINTENMLFLPVPTVEELNTQLINLIDELSPDDRVFIGIDSIGNISTKAELINKTVGSDSRDFTKQTALRALFRTVTLKAGMKNVPIVPINHTYSQIMGFGGPVISGGEGSLYNSSIISEFYKSQVKDGDETTGIQITSHNKKCRTAKQFTKINFSIDFEKGLTPYSGLYEFCYNDEKIFIKEKNSYKIDPKKIPSLEHRKDDLFTRAKMSPQFWEDFLKQGLADYMRTRFSYQSVSEELGIKEDEEVDE